MGLWHYEERYSVDQDCSRYGAGAGTVATMSGGRKVYLLYIREV